MSVCVCVFACGYGICIDDLRRFALRSRTAKIFTLLLTSSYHFVANFSDIALIAIQKVWYAFNG